MSNKIEVKLATSKYIDAEHLNIFIDGIQLDQLLHMAYPDQMLLGLIPSFLNYYEEEETKKDSLGQSIFK